LVQKALEAAESIGGVATEFVSLRGKLIKPCMADYACFKKATPEIPCPSITDDYGNEVMKKMIAADGILVGTPVYYGGPTAQIKALLDRSMALETLAFALRNKVGGGITVSYDRNGGQESTLFDMIRWMMIHDMIVVSVGPDRPAKTGIGSFWGGVCTQGFPYPKPSPTKEARKGAIEDEVGLNSVVGIGKRVAETAKLIKAGLSAVPEKELGWPRKLKVEMLDLYADLYGNAISEDDRGNKQIKK
jgi:multimeric flavodoxin WrbA